MATTVRLIITLVVVLSISITLRSTTHHLISDSLTVNYRRELTSRLSRGNHLTMHDERMRGGLDLFVVATLGVPPGEHRISPLWKHVVSINQ